MLARETIRQLIQRALDEDLPDITSEAIFSPADRGSATFLAKSAGVLAGLAFAEETFSMLDASSRFKSHVPDGSRLQPGQTLAEVDASVIALLSGERNRASRPATMTVGRQDNVTS